MKSFSEETDEQIAQRLAAEWNAEESRKAEEKIRQELIDEEYARRLTESGEFSASSSGMNPDVMTGSTSSYQNALSGSSSASSYQAQVPPYQPPSYDFAVREQPPQDLLIDFSSQPSNVCSRQFEANRICSGASSSSQLSTEQSDINSQ